MYVCIDTFSYDHKHVCIICIPIHVCNAVCMHADNHLCTCVCNDVYTHSFMYVCVNICMCIFLGYVYVFIYALLFWLYNTYHLKDNFWNIFSWWKIVFIDNKAPKFSIGIWVIWKYLHCPQPPPPPHQKNIHIMPIKLEEEELENFVRF